jgi:hypothetical protein
MKKFFLIIFFLAGSSFASAQSLKNITLLDSIYKRAAFSIATEALALNLPHINIALEGHSSKWMLEKNLARILIDKGVQVGLDTNNIFPVLKLYILDVAINYETVNENELVRNITITGDAILSDKQVLLAHPLKEQYNDVIKWDDLGDIESDYPYSKPKVPDRPMTFLKKYLEPIIITGAAIITTALLFTVRSSSQ